MKNYIKKIDKDLLLEDLENTKNDIDLRQYQFIKNYINDDTNFDEDEFCDLGIDDLDIVHRLNVLELESLNFEAVLPDCSCDLPVEDFLSAFWKTLNTNIMDFILPFNSEYTPDYFNNDAYAFISAYQTLHKVDISSMRSDIESVFRGLHNQLNIRCIDTDEEHFSSDKKILDYDDYKLIELTI
jgi:hypothetical protein